MNNPGNGQPDDDPAASQGKARTWPRGVPPLRLNRRPGAIAAAAPAPSATQPVPTLANPPRLLWLRRLVTGVLLLALAWLCLLLVAALGMSAWASIPHQKLSLRMLLSILEAAGACWMGVVAIVCLLTGAFSLTLALTTRRW